MQEGKVVTMEERVGRRPSRLSRRASLKAGLSALATTQVSLLAACGRVQQRGAARSNQANRPRSGGILTGSLPSDPPDWDPSYLGKSGGTIGFVLCYNNLVRFKAGGNTGFAQQVLEPELAEQWEIPDPATFIFHVRKGVRFANLPPVGGRELTSADVKFSYEYWARAGQVADRHLPAGQWAWMFEGLKSIETPDPSTAIVHFDAPFVPFLNYAAAERAVPIVPHEIYDVDGHFKNRIAGTGPFQLDVASSQKGSRWVWKKNPLYWEAGKPYVNEIDELIVPDDSSVYAAFRAKQLDSIGGAMDFQAAVIDCTNADTISKANPSAQMREFLQPKPRLLYMNVTQPPFTDIRMRQAVSMALDRDGLIKTLSCGKGGWALAGALDGLFTQEEVKQMLHHDAAQARQLVAAAGYPNGLEVECIYPGQEYGQFFITELQLFQAQMKAANINLTLKNVQTAEEFAKRKKEHNFTITTTPAAAEDGDVDAWIYGDLYPGSTKNYEGVNDPQLAKMLIDERSETDPAKRREVLRQIVRYVNVEKVWGLSLYHGTEYQFWQPYLQNIGPSFWTKRWAAVHQWLAK